MRVGHEVFYFLLKPENVKLNLSVEEFAQELINSSRLASCATWKAGGGEGG